MFSTEEKARRTAAAEKRLAAAHERIEKYERKAEEAKAAAATEAGILGWLESMPIPPGRNDRDRA